MRIFSLYRVELRRLTLSKFFWVIATLSLCGPLFGYSIFRQCMDSSEMTGRYIANPVLAGAVIGAVLWALLAILESDRVYRAKTDALMDAIISPVSMALSRILALLTLSTVTTLICVLIYLPYTIVKINYLFDIRLYIYSFVILLMLTWWISVLLADALYQITRRIELAGLLYAGCVYFSFSQYVHINYFARWLNPLITGYSDGFSSAFPLRITLYTRVLWLALSGGVWVFSLLCVRRYQKRLASSFLYGVLKAYLPVISAALLCVGVMLWVGQPFVNHSPLEYNTNFLSEMQSTSDISFQPIYKLSATPSGCVTGIAQYTIDKYGSSKTPDCIWLDPGYQILSVTCNGKKLAFKTLHNDVNDVRQTTFTIPQGSGETLVIRYRGMPQILRCFSPYSWYDVTSDYVALSNGASVPFTSFRLPQYCQLELTLPEKLTPVVEHEVLTNFTQNNNGTRTWKTADLRSVYLWITACNYASEQFQAAGATINLLYSKKYDQNIRKFDIPKGIADVMDYCTTHLGFLSFVAGGQLIMVQRDNSNGEGGNAGPGWVEWSEGIFTDINLSDRLKGASAEEVFAHEIIHEWWGGFGVYCGDDGLWSNEGLDVYTTYRLMEEKYGLLYAKQNYVDIWQAAVDKQKRGYYYRHPEALKKLPAQYQAELKAQAQQINQYCRMPLMILKAQQIVGGEKKMDIILQSIQEKYSQAPDKYTNPFTYQMFLDACRLTKEDLNLG